MIPSSSPSDLSRSSACSGRPLLGIGMVPCATKVPDIFKNLLSGLVLTPRWHSLFLGLSSWSKLYNGYMKCLLGNISSFIKASYYYRHIVISLLFYAMCHYFSGFGISSHSGFIHKLAVTCEELLACRTHHATELSSWGSTHVYRFVCMLQQNKLIAVDFLKLRRSRSMTVFFPASQCSRYLWSEWIPPSIQFGQAHSMYRASLKSGLLDRWHHSWIWRNSSKYSKYFGELSPLPFDRSTPQ